MSIGEKRMIQTLTKRSFKMNQRRNTFMIATIALTAFMLTCILSLSMSWYESVRMGHIRLNGTIAHGGFPQPTSEQLEQLQRLDYIEAIGVSTYVGRVLNTDQMGGIELSMIYADEMQWEFMSPARVDIVGETPKSKDEIMLSREVLERMGIYNPEIGMEILLAYELSGGENDTYEGVFKLSGFYTDFGHLIWPPSEQRNLWISESFALHHERTIQEGGRVDLLFNSDHLDRRVEEQLEIDVGLTLIQQMGLMDSLYGTGYDNLNIIPVVVASIIILLMTGGVSIYNVFYTSVLKDIRFYGLLNTVGLSAKQLKQVMARQIWCFCLIGIPGGLLTGFITSRVFIPYIMRTMVTGTVHSFSPFIYIGTAFFTVLITFAGGMISIKKTIKLSAVEATKYIGEQRVKVKSRKYFRGTLINMAFRNIFRDQKRAALTFLSLFLGGASFVIVTVLVSSLDTERFVESIVASDIVIENQSFSQESHNQLFNEFLFEQIHALPGIEHVYHFTQYPVGITYTPAFDAHIRHYVEEQLLIYEQRGIEMELTPEDVANRFMGLIVGIDLETIPDLHEILENPIDLEAFDRGEFALISASENLYEELSEIEATFLNNEDSFVIPFGGILPLQDVFTPYGADIIFFVSHAFMESLLEEPIISEIRLMVTEGYEEEVYLSLKEITADIEFSINMDSKFEFQQLVQSDIVSLSVLGVSISIILGLIGILNVMNNTLVGIMIRKREFAMLESIGMTRKQLRKMLTYEGGWTAIVILLMVTIFGNAIAFIFYRLVERSGIWMRLNYPFVPVFIASIVILVISMIIPEISYRMEGNRSIIERLREAE